MLVMFCSTFPVRAPSNGLARRSTKSFSAATLLQSRERVWEQLFVVLLGVTIFFGESYDKKRNGFSGCSVNFS